MGLCIGSFWDKVLLMRAHPHVPIDNTIVMVFAVGLFNALGACAAAYLVGFGINALLGS